MKNWKELSGEWNHTQVLGVDGVIRQTESDFEGTYSQPKVAK